VSGQPRWRNAKLWGATGLLPVGVCLVAVTAETHRVAPSLVGYACLLFVPGLIIDVVVDALRADAPAELQAELHKRREAPGRPGDPPATGGEPQPTG